MCVEISLTRPWGNASEIAPLTHDRESPPSGAVRLWAYFLFYLECRRKLVLSSDAEYCTNPEAVCLPATSNLKRHLSALWSVRQIRRPSKFVNGNLEIDVFFLSKTVIADQMFMALL